MERQERVDDGRRFGRYLRRIREQRKLSLDAVEEMSLGYRERVTKSHLSRIESGQATPSFPRMFTLSQIYGVPVTSLAERFELELVRERVAVELNDWAPSAIFAEVDRLKRSGKYDQLLVLAVTGLEKCADAPPAILHRLRLCHANALLHLERYETAKTESEALLAVSDLDPEVQVLALFLFSICSYRLKRYTVCQMGLDAAERLLHETEGSAKSWADLQLHRAAACFALGQAAEAAQGYERAAELYDQVPDVFEACRARVNLGQALIQQDELKSARRVLEAALEVAEDASYDKLRGLALSHLGMVGYREGTAAVSEAYLLRSNAIARPREYLTMLFRNSYYLWQLAQQREDGQSAKSYERTLRAHLGRIDPDLPEAVLFRDRLKGGGSGV